jgi:hypothetical protein
MATSHSIGELSVALAHRWKPERVFMILTGYFDESGVHKSSPITMMAGFVADARQWRSYEKRVTKLFRRFKVDIFHAIDVRRGDDCFAGWTVNKKMSFLDEFHHIINETTEIGFNSVITDEDYRWYLALKRPANVRAHSKYAILVRASLSSAVDSAIRVERWATGSEPSLNVVLELGHKNSGEALDFYEQVRTMYPGRKALGGSHISIKEGMSAAGRVGPVCLHRLPH